MPTIKKEQEEKQYWRVKDFAIKVGVHRNTIDNWFKGLENHNIHFLQRVGGYRIYDEQDLEIARYINNKRDDNWNVEAIFNFMKDNETGLKFREASTVGVNNDGTNNDTDDTDDIEDNAVNMTYSELEVHLKEFAHGLQESWTGQMQEWSKQNGTLIREMVREEITKQSSRLIEEKSGSQRQKNLDMVITQRRIEENLKDEAKRKWDNLPEEDKMKKVGWFRKEEDQRKRADFIDKYVSEHFEKSLMKEIGE